MLAALAWLMFSASAILMAKSARPCTNWSRSGPPAASRPEQPAGSSSPTTSSRNWRHWRRRAPTRRDDAAGEDHGDLASTYRHAVLLGLVVGAPPSSPRLGAS